MWLRRTLLWVIVCKHKRMCALSYSVVFPGSPPSVFQSEKLLEEVSYISLLGVASLFWGPQFRELGLRLQLGLMDHCLPQIQPPPSIESRCSMTLLLGDMAQYWQWNEAPPVAWMDLMHLSISVCWLADVEICFGWARLPWHQRGKHAKQQWFIDLQSSKHPHLFSLGTNKSTSQTLIIIHKNVVGLSWFLVKYSGVWKTKPKAIPSDCPHQTIRSRRFCLFSVSVNWILGTNCTENPKRKSLELCVFKWLSDLLGLHAYYVPHQCSLKTSL